MSWRIRFRFIGLLIGILAAKPKQEKETLIYLYKSDAKHKHMQTHVYTQSLAKEMLIQPLNQTLQPNITLETSKNKLTFVCVSEYGQDEKSSSVFSCY